LRYYSGSAQRRIWARIFKQWVFAKLWPVQIIAPALQTLLPPKKKVEIAGLLDLSKDRFKCLFCPPGNDFDIHFPNASKCIKSKRVA